MDIRERRYFYTIVEEGNISSADQMNKIKNPANTFKYLQDSLFYFFERTSHSWRKH